jgi:hypothetical protein
MEKADADEGCAGIAVGSDKLIAAVILIFFHSMREEHQHRNQQNHKPKQPIISSVVNHNQKRPTDVIH